MKKMKKFLSLALAGALAVSTLSGCGSKAASDTWKFGGIGPITGSYAQYGLGCKNAIQIAVDEINEAGGINGVKIEYKFEDDEVDNEKSVNAYNALKDWGMNVLIGSTTSGCSIAVSEKTSQDNMFQITPSASSADAVVKGNVFQVCFTDPNQGVNAAKFLAQKYADEKFVLFYNSGDAYSSGIADAFKAQAAESKLEIVDEETFKDDSSTSFTNQLTKAKQAGATMIFAPIYYTPASVLLKNAKDMGYDVKMMGCDGMDGILGVEGFDTSLAEGLLLMTPFSADDEKNADFVKAYKEEYDETPNQFAADAYDCVHAIAEAIDKAGIDTTADGADIAADLAKAMRKIKIDGLTGELTWNDEGQVEKPATAYVIQDGKYIAA